MWWCKDNAQTLSGPASLPCVFLPLQLHRFAKGVLAGVVPWREARRFFAWRLKRRLTEEGLIRHISSTDVSINRLDAIAMVRDTDTSSVLHHSISTRRPLQKPMSFARVCYCLLLTSNHVRKRISGGPIQPYTV